MPRHLLLTITLMLATSCATDTGLELASDWQVSVISEWQDEKPDMLVFSDDGKTLFISCETNSDMLSPSLARIDLQNGQRETILYGLHRADGLKIDRHGDIWLGEETADGLVYKISSPQGIAAEQRVDRARVVASHPNIAPVLAAGRFSHEGMAFSGNHRYLYLADEWKEGCLYRYELSSGKLTVFHSKKGWLEINTPKDARFKAEVLHGTYFERLEDMELLPDGTILMAETGAGDRTGRIWRLDDRGIQPTVSHYLEHPDLAHPDNLEWDEKRGWLWITDDSSPSKLLAWDGKKVIRIATHRTGEITGIESRHDGSLWFNLQHRIFGPDLTMKIDTINDIDNGETR